MKENPFSVPSEKERKKKNQLFTKQKKKRRNYSNHSIFKGEEKKHFFKL